MNKNRQKKACLLSAFMVFGAMAAYAQSPGGISTAPAVWYKPDSVSASKWKDASINGLDLTTQDTTATYRVSVNNGNQVHNFHKWTNGYTNTKYYSYRATTNPAFGTWGDGGVTTTASTDYSGNYYYMPLTVFGVARGTVANGTGAITGIDNDQGYGAEPGFGIYGGKQSFYRYGNGADIRNNAAAIAAPVNASAVYTWRPPAGGSTANGNDTLLMGTNGAYSKISISRRSSVAGPHINIGTDNFAYPNGFDGSIQEVIWYKDSLSISDIQKVETYLALKYGSTLAHNYVNAAGNTIYNVSGADSNYRYNIAGIGRESANGALNQKQSNSVNPGNQLLVSTTGLANTNSSNAIALTNGQFLVWGDNGLDKLPIVPVTNISGTNYRFASVWKAHNTGAVGTVRVAWPQNAAYIAIKLVQSSDATFATGNTISDMTNNTITINGVVYNYVDVAIADGQYFTIAVKAQTPGGVGMPAVWLKANAGTDIATDPGHVSSMANYGYAGGNAEQIVSGATTYDAPYYNENLHNFNPSLVDSTTNANGGLELKDVFPTYEQRALSTFVLQDQPNVGVQSTMVSFVNQDNFTASYDLPWFASQSATQLYFWWDGTGSAAPTITNGLKRYNNIPTINSYHRALWASNPDTTFLGMNGVGKMYAVGNSAASLGIGQHLLVNADGGNNNPSGGNISEVIVYDRDLTATERLQVNSYMAIKYGITLLNEDGTNTTDYLSSTATVVWDTLVNDGYNNNIAGIANDANSGIDQKQSKSVNAGQQVLISTTGLANSNAANSVSLTDGQYLVWGDNDSARTPSHYNPSLGHNVNMLFASVWKVQNTGGAGTVRVAWQSTYNTLSLVQSSDDVFDNTDTYTDMSNTVTINGVVYHYADVTLSNGQYFTFATKLEHAPGGVFNNLTLWYRADKAATNTGEGTDVTQWSDYAFNVPVASVDADALPTYASGSADSLNFNPGILFTTAQKLANISGSYALSSLNYDIFTTARQGMNGTRLFSIGADNSTTHGGSNWDQPAIYDNGSFLRRNNAFGGIISNGNGGYANSTVQPNIGYYTVTDTTYGRALNGSKLSAMTANGGNAHAGLSQGGHIFGRNAGTATNGDDAGVNGMLGETIVYGAGSLTAAERNKVNSYLAIKYGVTMDTASSYITSDSTVIWNRVSDKYFYHNVAGIGTDTISALYQKQSRSQITNNTNNQVTIAVDSIYATNVANPGIIGNMDFMVWGDNGNTQAMSNTASTYTTFTFNGSSDNRHMTRIWKVRNTNVTSQVAISFPTASVGTTTLPNEGTNTAYVLIYASDSNFSNITAISYLSEKAGQYVSAHKFSNGVSYFTYAKVTDSASALPVTLLDFNAEKVKHEVQLSWMTTNEANSKGFEVERSANAADWKAIGFVLSNADNGNSNLKLSYLFNDVQPTNGKNFYRLKEVDINGNYSYSEVRMVNFADGSSIQIHPNPVQDNVMVSGLTGNRQIVVTNVLGQVVLRAQTNGEATKELHTAVLTPGTYFITITDEQNEKVNFKMIKE